MQQREREGWGRKEYFLFAKKAKKARKKSGCNNNIWYLCNIFSSILLFLSYFLIFQLKRKKAGLSERKGEKTNSLSFSIGFKTVWWLIVWRSYHIACMHERGPASRSRNNSRAKKKNHENKSEWQHKSMHTSREIVHVATKQHNNILFHEQHGQVAMHDVLLLSINMASLFSWEAVNDITQDNHTKAVLFSPVMCKWVLS